MTGTLIHPGRAPKPRAAPPTAVPRVSGRHRSVGHRSAGSGALRRVRAAVATALFLLAALVLLAVTVGPRVLHYRTATMLTGSMAPGIVPGDVILDTTEPADEIAVGQIITYHIPVQDRRIESHRVVWVGRDRDGAVLMRTKGDANSAPDPWTARIDGGQVWRVRAVVPFAGQVIRALRRPVVRLMFTAALPIGLVGWLLVSIWRPRSLAQDADERAAGPNPRD